VTAARFHLSREQVFDAAGNPLSGGRLYFYVTGTTTTLATYSNPALTTANAQPVVADSAGRFGDIYLLDQAYRVQLRDALDVLIWDTDGVYKDVTSIRAASLPAAAFPGMLVFNTSDSKRYRRNSTNTAWIEEGPIDGVGNTATAADVVAGTSATLFATPDAIGALWERQPDIASTATLVLSAGGYYEVTGTAGISGINSARSGLEVQLRFQNALTLTHSGSFALIGGVNIVTEPGDVATFRNVSAVATSGSTWRMTDYQRATGEPLLRTVDAPKTGNYTVTDADRGALIRFSGLSADATLGLPAASGRAGFIVYMVNNDANDTVGYGVIVDPNAGETLDGFATRKGYTGTRVTLLCDGTGWRTVSGYYRYFSGDQTPAASGLLPLAHGLGVRPRRVFSELKCNSVEAGYAVGDIIPVQLYDNNAASTGGVGVYIDATNVNVRWYGSLAAVVHKTTGAATAITNANWRIRFYAEE
jgi:hypothetical protein